MNSPDVTTDGRPPHGTALIPAPLKHLTATPSRRHRVPPQWAPDPTLRYGLRWWDGRRWTEHVADDRWLGVDPLPAPRVALPPAAHPSGRAVRALGALTTAGRWLLAVPALTFSRHGSHTARAGRGTGVGTAGTVAAGTVALVGAVVAGVILAFGGGGTSIVPTPAAAPGRPAAPATAPPAAGRSGPAGWAPARSAPTGSAPARSAPVRSPLTGSSAVGPVPVGPIPGGPVPGGPVPGGQASSGSGPASGGSAGSPSGRAHRGSAASGVPAHDVRPGAPCGRPGAPGLTDTGKRMRCTTSTTDHHYRWRPA